MSRLKSYLIYLISFVLLLIPFAATAQGATDGAISGKLAVTSPGYDDIGEVLQELGFTAEEIEESSLATLSELQKYDAVYINCSGSIDGVAQEAAPAIRDYVRGGGIIYASDFAASIVNAAFPNKINFYKGDSATETSLDGTSAARIGTAGKVQAKVTDSGLAAVLGKRTIEINYDLGAWVVIDSVPSSTRVHVTGPASIMDYSASMEKLQNLQNLDFSNPQAVEELSKEFSGEAATTLQDKPYIVTFTEGDGEVLYTTFHNEAQKTEDTEDVLNWFGVRTKGGRLARATQDLVVKGDDVLLQEIVDGMNQDETKNYAFAASGESDFKVTLNFGGSALSLKITDPDGSQVVDKEVSSPPFTQSVQAKEGDFQIQVKGDDVSEKNMPFVVAVSGPEDAASLEMAVAEAAEEEALTWRDIIIQNLIKYVLIAGGVIVLIIVVIVVIIILARRKKTQPPQQPQQPQAPQQQ